MEKEKTKMTVTMWNMLMLILSFVHIIIIFICFYTSLSYIRNNRKEFGQIFALKNFIFITVLLLFFCLIAIFYYLPDNIAQTLVKIVDDKDKASKYCSILSNNGDYANARNAIRKGKISESLYDFDMKLIKSMSWNVKTLSYKIILYSNVYFEPLLTNTGVFYAAIPLLIFLFLKKVGFYNEIKSFYYFLTLLIGLITFGSLSYIFLLNIVVEYMRSSMCILVSGHWLLFIHTCCWVLLTLYFLFQIFTEFQVSKKSEYIFSFLFYLIWCFLYIFFGLLVMSSTQRYFHTNEEALEGLWLATYTFPILVFIPAFFLKFLFNR